jgi:spore coat polysaccharide biosynthesis protein SpsF
MDVKTILITQARLGSTRLPGKVLKEIDGKSLLQIHLERLSKCKKVDHIVVATTTNDDDDIIYRKSLEWGFNVYRGSENDVLDRFYNSVKIPNPKWVVRVTSDCPLIDPELVDDVIEFVELNNKDYGSNTLIQHFPDGQDVEVFKFSALKTAWESATLNSDREHVTPFIRRNSDFMGSDLFSSINYPCDHDYSKIRMTVDEINDFELVSKLVNSLGIDQNWVSYTKYIIENSLFEINSSIIRNEGFLKSLKND